MTDEKTKCVWCDATITKRTAVLFRMPTRAVDSEWELCGTCAELAHDAVHDAIGHRFGLHSKGKPVKIR